MPLTEGSHAVLWVDYAAAFAAGHCHCPMAWTRSPCCRRPKALCKTAALAGLEWVGLVCVEFFPSPHRETLKGLDFLSKGEASAKYTQACQ